MSDPVTLFFVVTAAATGVEAYSQYEAGKAQQYQYEAEAEQAKSGARDQEIERRQRLLKALASRQVATAAGGTTPAGTPMALINEDYRQAELDKQTLEGTTAARVSTLKTAARNARSLGTLNAVGSLLQGGAQLASIGRPKPKQGSSAPRPGPSND